MLTTEEQLKLENNYLKMELVKKDLAELKKEQRVMLSGVCERLGKKVEDLLTFHPLTGELTFKEENKIKEQK